MTSSTTPNKSNILPLALSDYTPVSASEKVDRAGYVRFGDDNLFPQYLRELSETSPIHGSLCISIGDMIAGKNLNAGNYQQRVDALGVYDVYSLCAHDFKKFGGFYVEVIYTVDRRSIAKLNHLPYEECRVAVETDDEMCVGVYQSNDWADTRKKKNKPCFIPRFNPLKSASEARQVYWYFRPTSGQTYPRPDYWSAVNYIELSKQIGIFHVNGISNGLFPSFIINFYNGQLDPDTQRNMMNDWERKMSGARNAGKFIMTFNEEGATKPDITPFPLNDADKLYEYLTDTSRTEVLTAHRVVTPLIFGIRDVGGGFGSNKDEMAIGLEIFTNQVIEPAQRMLARAFTEILSFELPGVSVSVIPNTPLKQAEIQTETTQISPNTAQPVSMSKTEGDCCKVHLNAEFANELIKLGEDGDDDWVLIDKYEVSYDDDDEDNDNISKIELASTGVARPNSESSQDAVIKGRNFYVRYRYSGNLEPNTREFCAEMLKANKLYRKEDVLAMNKVAVNPGWGPYGADTYNIWLFKGGGNCWHWWSKEIYVSAKGFDLDLSSPFLRTTAQSKAASMGYKVRNQYLVEVMPVDMPHRGFMPDNPIYGNG